jgi:sugar lactone lactonase YvrE
MNVKLYPTEDPDFDSVRPLKAFEAITKLRDELQIQVANSQLAFTNAEQDMHPESIAYDPLSKCFLLSSVHKNKIIKYDPYTKTSEDWKASNEEGLWAVMGMRVDAKKKVLWVCTVATKEMMSYQDSLAGKTALYKYDLKTKKLLKRYELTGGHWFGDVVIAQDGTPYISDSMKPIIYTVDDDEITVFKDFSSELFNLQGLAFDASEEKLFIADYKLGLHVYDISKATLEMVGCPDNIITKGIDGLYYRNKKLIAIQNGVHPMRVSEYQLDDVQSNIATTRYLDRGRPELGEPTLGVIVEDSFYYIANSPWGKYDREGQLKADALTDNVVLKFGLEPLK